MTSRDLVIAALNHQPVERIPRDLHCEPGVKMLRADEMAEIEVRYPRDVVSPDFKYPAGSRAKGKPYQRGEYTDAWGCTWHVAQRGTIGRIEHPPLGEAAKVDAWQPPFELLNGAKLGRVNRSCAAESRFVLARTQTRPLDRIRFLRGSTAALRDLGQGTKRIRGLLARLHDFSCREMEMWAGSDVDGVALRDDWGAANGLMASAEIWEDLFQPLYHEYCEILHAKDKFVFFHSDGDIFDLFKGLVDTGIDAVRAQLLSMKVERLAKRFRGKVTFWGEADLPQCSNGGNPEQLTEAVVRLRRALDFGSGGVIASCQWADDVPIGHVATVFEQWMLPLPMHA